MIPDDQAERIILAVQELALMMRDEDMPARREAAEKALAAAGGDPIAALCVAAAQLNIADQVDTWWSPEELPRQLAPCGTPGAYARHLKFGERPDDVCRSAHREARKARRHRQEAAA